MKYKNLHSVVLHFSTRMAVPVHGLASVMAISAMLAPGHSAAAAESSGVSAGSNDPMVLVDTETLTVRSHLQFGLNAVAENNLFWNLAESAAGNTEFNADGSEERTSGGDLFYWPPGHSVRAEAYAELILFSPQHEHSHVMDHMLAKMAG